MARDLFTVKELMDKTGISRSFAYKLISNGEIPVIRLGKRHVLIPGVYIRKITEEPQKTGGEAR